MTRQIDEEVRVSLITTTLRLLRALMGVRYAPSLVASCIATLVVKAERICDRDLLNEMISLYRERNDRERMGICQECGKKDAISGNLLCEDCISLTADEARKALLSEDLTKWTPPPGRKVS